MEQPTATVSPLRRRMADDMRMRNFKPKTQATYLRAVSKLGKFLERSPHPATADDLRRFQLHLVDDGTSPITLNATISGLKFFFDVTLNHPELMARMQPVKVPRTLPVVLSREEVSRLIAAAWNLKHQTALSVAYGAGLRASEVVSLKVGDVDSQRMTLRVEQGKGRKDRYAMLPPILLERLRVWWRVGHAQGKILRDGWLFPGMDPTDPLTTRQLNRAIHAAADAAKLDKRVSMHTLRHYPASRNIPRELGCARDARGICDILRLVRSAYSVTSQRLEEGQQLVVRLEFALAGALRFDLVEGCLLDFEVGVEIDLRRLDRLVPEQHGNHGGLHAGLEEFHRRGVAQHVRGHALVLERRADPASLFDVLGQQIVNAIGTQASTTRAGKDDRSIVVGDFAQPSLHDSGRLPGQRCRAFLATLADDMHMGSRAKTNSMPTQAGDFRDAQPRLDGQQHECVIAPPRPSVQIGRTQNSVNLRPREKSDVRPRAALVRNGQDTLYLRGVSRHLEGRVPKERTDGGQSQIAAGRTDASVGLHVVEKRRHQRCIDLLELQPLRGNTKMVLGKLQQQPETVAVRADGVGTGLALLHQPAREEALQQCGERGRGHGLPSQRRSMRSTASRMSCG